MASSIVPRTPGLSAAIGVAAAAMVATLPGRTHGLGLITEPLLKELELDRVAFAALNFWATLLGAVFCLPVGWLIDRIDIRVMLASVSIGLGAVVLGMVHLHTDTQMISLYVPRGLVGEVSGQVPVPAQLFLLILLTRGLGQSALSVVSLALIGKSSGEKPGRAIGIYSFCVAIGFMAAFGLIKYLFEKAGWQWKQVWVGIGWAVIAFGVIGTMLVPRTNIPTASINQEGKLSETGSTLIQALRTPAFWVFAIGTSFYGMVASGMSLFHQSLLEERGFERSVFLTITIISPMIGLAANLLTGFLATRIRLGVLLAISLTLQSLALFAFPHVSTLMHVYLYASAMGVAGGMLTVVFFTVWRQAYGTLHLGKIQGAAQLLTVLASALGPLILAAGRQAAGSYAPVVQQLAIAGLVIAFAALLVRLPSHKDSV
jgi:MFS family permease